MKKIFSAVGASTALLLVGVYILVPPEAEVTEPVPRWSCNYVRPPVEEAPTGLIVRAGFRDRPSLQEFVDENEAALRWTYLAVQSGLRPVELEVLRCFEKRSEGAMATITGSAEARLVWHLTSDGKIAIADGFELALLNGHPSLASWARTCLDQHLFGKTFEVRRLSKQDFIKYKGVFPFHRRLRFSTEKPAPAQGTESLAPT